MKGPLKFSLKDRNILKPVYSFARAKKIKLYLVGGALRDLILRRQKENPDFDFCLKSGAISFGRKLANKIKAGFVVLDQEHGACRLVKKLKDRTYTLDFTDFRGKTLKEDLLHRDFTINAMALELAKAFSGNLECALVDFYAGKEDLKNRLIKTVNKKAFSEDPLRILRAFSYACMLGFKIDKETQRLAKSEKARLSSVSYERIREELFKIFDTSCAFNYLVMLDELKILEIIFPEIKPMRGIGQGPYHHLDVWQHTLESVSQLELLISQMRNKQEIQGYLNEFITGDRRRRALIKLGAFLHDVGKPKALRHEEGKTTFHAHERIGLEIAEEITRRLKLSNDEINSLRKMILCHLRPGYLADNQQLSPRAKFRYFRDSDKEAVSVLLLSIADQRATKGPLTTPDSRTRHEKVCSALIREYFAKKKEKKKPRILDGNDLIREFKLEPSPLIGKILSEIEELQAVGLIKTKQAALRAAKKFIKK